MNSLLSQIKRSLSGDLKKYEITFKSVMKSNISLVDTIAKYIVRYKGKGLRPLLVLLCARLLGDPNKQTFLVATSIELLHTATLVHDDVVDEATVRRKFPSINSLWKNKISVLMGDYLLSKSLICATQAENMEIMQVLADTAKRLSKGELFQIEKSRKLDITEEEYFQMISDKTAALISACCELGAITISSNAEDRQRLKIFGENIGIAFQIKDDLLDYEGTQKIIGKAVGADLREKKITLPLLLSFKKAPVREKKVIIKLLKKGANANDIKRIIAFSSKYGGLQSAGEVAQTYARKAKDQILSFPDTPAKENALKFVDFIISRQK